MSDRSHPDESADRPTQHDVTILMPRGRLRTVTMQQVTPEYVSWLNDPEVNRYLESRFMCHTLETVEAFVGGLGEDPSTIFLAIEVGDSSRHIGNIKLGPIDNRHRTGDIGLLIGDRAYWGKGYAREAIQALTTYAFTHLNLAKVTAGAYGANIGSIRAFRRAGFQVEGCRKSQVGSGDIRDDVVLLGCVAAPDVTEGQWPEGYRCAPLIDNQDGDVRIRTIRWEDRESIRRWRNAQLGVLRQVTEISVEEQDRYFQEKVRPQLDERQPGQVLVGILEGERLIGYGGLVHISWMHRRAEVSVLFDPEVASSARYGELVERFICLLRQVAAGQLGLHRLTTEAYEFRTSTIDALEASGFEREGTLREHVWVGDRYVDSIVHGLMLAEQR